LKPTERTGRQQFEADLDRTFRAPLTAFFLKRVRDRAEADDLTQEVFLRILRQAEGIDPGRAKAYVFTAAANLLRDRSRMSAFRRTDALVESDERIIAGLVEDISPERVLLGKQTLRAVMSALDGLETRTRDIFVLYRIERMKQQEIANLLGISLSSVEKHLVKAVTFLTQKFDWP
jgi:RNA polymerase sigma factor (sigma-70 family)